MNIETNVYTLAHDLCDGFENKYNEEKVVQALNKAMEEENYTIEELWDMNDEDSGKVYDILVDYYDFN